MNVKAQEETILFYVTKAEHNFDECTASGTSVESRKQILLPAGSKFTIIKKLDNDEGYVIKFWDWEDKTINTIENLKTALNSKNVNLNFTKPIKLKEMTTGQKIEQYNYYLNNNEITQRYFQISDAELKMYAVPIEKKWGATVGNLAMPIKYRFKTDEVVKDFTFSSMGGFKYTFKKDQSFSFIGGVGLTSVNLDSLNSDLKTEDEKSAISLPLGIVYQYKILQIGVIYGFDYLIKNDLVNWQNHKRPWLSLGIGIAIFTDTKEAVKEEKN
jgi:hypothetical protein